MAYKFPKLLLELNVNSRFSFGKETNVNVSYLVTSQVLIQHAKSYYVDFFFTMLATINQVIDPVCWSDNAID